MPRVGLNSREFSALLNNLSAVTPEERRRRVARARELYKSVERPSFSDFKVLVRWEKYYSVEPSVWKP